VIGGGTAMPGTQISVTGTSTPRSDRGEWRAKARENLDRLLDLARAQGQTVYGSVAVPMPGMDPLAWVRQFDEFPAIYWRDRERQEESACIGATATLAASGQSARESTSKRAAGVLAQCHLLHGTPPVSPRLYGGFAFDPLAGPDNRIWQGFADAMLVLPEARLTRDARGASCVVTVPATPQDSADALLDSLDDKIARFSATPSALAQDPVSPILSLVGDRDDGAWTGAVGRALRLIADGRLDKVVLSRRLCATTETALSAWAVMRRLRDASPGCYHFCYRFSRDHAFVGASPECLFRFQGRQIESECVAGTIERGADAEADKRLAGQLLASEKDRREHSYVVEHSLQGLGTLCESMHADTSPRVLPLSTLQHLITRIHGVLRTDVGVGDVLEQLHPTAAVGGVPRDAALAAIRELEPQSRGWYCGPVGWWEPDRAEFAVAIRSAMITGSEAHVFAGAGIVSGSIPEMEWQETHNKAQAFLKVLRA
jgi:menaquinone-specific isochorismate synthase